MLVILPFCARDKSQAVQLAEWIAELGGVGKHDCLLVVHKDTDSDGVLGPLKTAFLRVAELLINEDMIVEREQHTYAANLMWKRVVNHVADMNESQPFLWIEPDAIPITAEWLDSIEAEYRNCRKPFLHDLVTVGGRKSNSGCGVYPAKVRDYTDRLWELSNISWDVLFYEDFAPHTAYTPLIQDIGFLKDGETLPTFPDQASLSVLRSGAVLFHRSKDGTLILRLREMTSGVALPASALSKSGDKVEAPPLTPTAPAIDPRIKRLIDLRGFDAERALKLETDNAPTRLNALGPNSPDWEFAEYEVRKVAASEIPGISVGDMVLFSRCAQPMALAPTSKPKARQKKKAKRVITAAGRLALQEAARKAREAKAAKAAA